MIIDHYPRINLFYPIPGEIDPGQYSIIIQLMINFLISMIKYGSWMFMIDNPQ